MRASELKEYNKVPEQNQFISLDFLNLGTIIGRIGTVIGQLDVYMIDDAERVYGVVDDNGDSVSYVGVKQGTGNYWYVRNASTVEEHRGKHIAKELLLFLLSSENMHRLSDVERSPSGEKLWFSFMKASGRQIKIADIKTQETFTLDDVGSIDADGVEILKPEDEEVGPDDIQDLRFFYLIEGAKHQKTIKNSKFGSPIDTKKGLGLIQPNRHF